MKVNDPNGLGNRSGSISLEFLGLKVLLYKIGSVCWLPMSFGLALLNPPAAFVAAGDEYALYSRT